jgi:hypothetical protein
LAPYRAVGERHQRLSQWQLHMGTTWRLFNHPQKAALFAEAKNLIDAMEDSVEPGWGLFTDALHTALSRRTLPLLAEGLKSLRNAAKIDASYLPALDSDAERKSAGGSNRRAAVDAYIEEVFREKGKRITRTDIWKSARYKSRTEFERWERNDPDRPNRTADELFTQILIDKPHLK